MKLLWPLMGVGTLRLGICALSFVYHMKICICRIKNNFLVVVWPHEYGVTRL